MRALLLLTLLGCPDGTPSDTADTADTGDTADTADTATDLPEGACRDDADCDPPDECFSADDPFCGEQPPPDRECEDDATCGAGNVCEEYTEACAEGPSSRCVAACADDAACGDALTCDEATGHCADARCDDGYTCPTHHTCDPAHLEGTGCRRDACADDADCGAGWCVEARCFEEPGTCAPQPP